MNHIFLRALAKGLVLFAAVNLLFAAIDPLPTLGRISIYNTLLPGRARLPYADDPAKAYNHTLDSLDAMFASHEIARAKTKDEYRIAVIGDSATWGWFLKPEQTLTGQLNALGLHHSDGRRMLFYNLGYPIMSLQKDVLILERAQHYDVDLFVWALTLESFPLTKQNSHPLVQANLPKSSDLWSRTLLGRRRDLADLARLQLFGVMWAATGIDQDYPIDYERAAIDLERDEKFGALALPLLDERALAWANLDAGIRLAQKSGADIVLLNEPILISNGRNSDVRYNFFYPRWAYDQYRAQLDAKATAQGLRLFDSWNLLPPDAFTNSAVHTTPAGASTLAQAFARFLRGA